MKELAIAQVNLEAESIKRIGSHRFQKTDTFDSDGYLLFADSENPTLVPANRLVFLYWLGKRNMGDDYVDGPEWRKS